ncbi:hypothetical protein ABIF66_001696 [Bradyrhizobium japonicum]
MHKPIPDDPYVRAAQVAEAYRAADRIYVIGSMERGVTVYKQQLRTHNLIWALWEIANKTGVIPQRIAVIGGGVAGLTAAAASSQLFACSQVTLFEQRWALCPLQQGADSRWLHPRIYDWPRGGSRAPSALLPVLNWSEGRASDVARQVIAGFSRYAAAAASRLRIYLGVNHVRVTASTRRIEWIGTEVAAGANFLQPLKAQGTAEEFDLIVVACGFGIEEHDKNFDIISYWRNEQLGQPVLNGTRQPYLISGYGDGALVDLCRLTISRFRQDSVLYELFGNRIEEAEAEIREARDKISSNFELFEELSTKLLKAPIEILSARVRTDTSVVLHLAGSSDGNKSILDVFGSQSSFLNQFLLYVLYRCGAFAASFEPLTKAVENWGVSPRNVLCRYGTNSTGHLLRLFEDPASVEGPIAVMKSKQEQVAARYWVPGCFKPLS